MAVKMSSADEALIAKYKQDWANATTQAERDAAHANAEAVRAGYGYSGGADGSGHIATGQSNAQNNAGTSKKYYTGSQPTYSTVGESAHNASKNASYDANTDYSTLLKQQISSGASVDDVYNTLASRIAKANGNDGLQQYAWDDTTRQAINYLVTQQGGSLEGIDATAAAQATLAARDGDYTLWNELGLGNRSSGTSGGTSAGRANGASGGTGAASGLGLTGMVADNSSYLEQLYAAKKAKALAELQAAYEQNVNAINRAGQGLEEQYQNARNQTAGASELAKRNFAQYAAANGLNSGAGGQAELARNVALQSDLNSINATEAQSFADIQLQRANAETNYNNAIAQAEAEGNYQLAAALYQEKVRVDEELLNLAITQYQLEYQAYRDSVSDSQWQQSFNQGVAQQNWSNNFAQTQYNNALLQQEWENTLAKLKYDASLKDDTEMTLNAAATMAEYGQFTDESLAAFYKNGFTEDYLKAKYGYRPPSEVNSEAYTAVANTLLSMVKSGANMTELRAALRDALVDGMVTQEQYEQLCATYTPGWRT